MRRRCKQSFRIALGVISLLLFSIGGYAQQANPATITGVNSGGVGYVTSSSGTNGISGNIGRWDAAYPYPDTGEPAPGLEPYGVSSLRIEVDVNDGGLASFSYQFLTYDAGIWDWLDIYIETPTGVVSLVNHLGKPGSVYGTYWESALIVMTRSLDAWRNQHVTFVFNVQQDGWGDQSAARIINFDIRTCQVPPLTQITDPIAIAFENGATIDTANLTAAMQTALACIEQAVAAAGGTFNLTSAYRPQQYQQHLREVWDRWNDLRNRREPECANLRAEVEGEFNRHGLLLTQRPAASSAHTTGQAFDASITLPAGQNVDTLAGNCQLVRPVPVTDPVHFVHQ